MNPDGISYLDIAREAMHAGPSALVNPLWSPLYPATIAVWEWLFQPPPLQEFAYIHALNAVIYTLAAISFAYLVRQWICFRSDAGRGLTRKAVFIAFAFALFFRFMNAGWVAFRVTPDLLADACAFLSAGLFFRILRVPGDWRTFATLGVTLAFGYFAKAIMLPAGFALLCILLLQSPRSRLHRRRVFIAAGAMCLVSLPLVLLISKQAGHFSFSEAGRLNYLWYVDGVKIFQGWTGTPGGDKPKHGPKVLEQDPKVIEFSSPVPGTYPLWYDPAYWYAGAKERVDLRTQLHLAKNSLEFYRLLYGDLQFPLEGLAVLAILAYVRRRRPARPELLLLLWPLAVCSMYAVLHTEYRYIAPFIVIFWIAAYSSIVELPGKMERVLLTAVAGLMLLSTLGELCFTYHKIILPGATYSPPKYAWIPISRNVSPDQIAARKLTTFGIGPGDPIATVGPAFADFCAHIARIHVVAEVVNADKFWRLSTEAAAYAEDKLAGTGAKVLLARNRPKGFQAGLWQDIPDTPYSVLRLRDCACASAGGTL